MGEWSNATKTSLGDGVIAKVDADAAAGKMKLYDGGTAGTLIATITLNDPSFSNSTGLLTMLGVPKSAASVASGNIDTYTLTDGADVVVREGGVGTSGSGKDVILTSTSITAPQNVQIDSFTINVAPDDAG